MAYNKSKTYLLPLVAQLYGFKEKHLKLIKNTYLFDQDDQFEKCFFIEQEFDLSNPEITHYEHELTNNSYFLKHYDYSNYVIYVFKFPEEYLKEYDLFIEGKYSKFQKDAKDLIIDFWTSLYGGFKDGINFVLKVKQILYKSKELKDVLEQELKVKLDDDAELSSLINKSEETINLNLFNDV